MTFINYDEFRKRQNTHFLFRYEIPTEFYVSLPMPTLRLGTPAYILFASPSSMRPGQPVSVEAPQLWWAIDAQKEKVLLYIQTKVLPFSKQKFDRCILPTIKRTLDEQEVLLNTLESQLTIAAEFFFQNRALDEEPRLALKENLTVYLPSVLFPCYKAISPDFFEWLFGDNLG